MDILQIGIVRIVGKAVRKYYDGTSSELLGLSTPGNPCNFAASETRGCLPSDETRWQVCVARGLKSTRCALPSLESRMKSNPQSPDSLSARIMARLPVTFPDA